MRPAVTSALSPFHFGSLNTLSRLVAPEQLAREAHLLHERSQLVFRNRIEVVVHRVEVAAAPLSPLQTWRQVVQVAF